VINFPNSTKCRLRGELLRQARPTTRRGSGSAKRISLMQLLDQMLGLSFTQGTGRDQNVRRESVGNADST